MICEYCGIEIGKSNFKRHTDICKLTDKIQDLYLNEMETIVSISRILKISQMSVFRALKGHTRSLSEARKVAYKQNPNKFKMSDDTKQKIRKKRIQWLKDNPEKHPWKKHTKFISKPCEKLKKILNNHNISFKSELTPLQNRHFSIDIALLDKRIGLEVNGNQHYNSDKTLKPYYKKRKELIEQNGWKIYDIHYSKIYDDEFILKLINELLMETPLTLDLDFDIRKTKNIIVSIVG